MQVVLSLVSLRVDFWEPLWVDSEPVRVKGACACPIKVGFTCIDPYGRLLFPKEDIDLPLGLQGFEEKRVRFLMQLKLSDFCYALKTNHV